MDRIAARDENPQATGWQTADYLGFELPPECIASVTANLAILAGHIAQIRATLEALARDSIL